MAGREAQVEGAAWLKVQMQEDTVPEGLTGGGCWHGRRAEKEDWVKVMLERTAEQAWQTGERTPASSSEQ